MHYVPDLYIPLIRKALVSQVNLSCHNLCVIPLCLAPEFIEFQNFIVVFSPFVNLSAIYWIFRSSGTNVA